MNECNQSNQIISYHCTVCLCHDQPIVTRQYHFQCADSFLSSHIKHWLLGFWPVKLVLYMPCSLAHTCQGNFPCSRLRYHECFSCCGSLIISHPGSSLRHYLCWRWVIHYTMCHHGVVMMSPMSESPVSVPSSPSQPERVRAEEKQSVRIDNLGCRTTLSQHNDDLYTTETTFFNLSSKEEFMRNFSLLN